MPAEGTVRIEERRRLVQELHDIVVHHLSNVTLRTMGRLDLDDLVGLQTVLADVDRSTRSALVELRLLAHVLADDPGTVAEVGAVARLSRRLAPTAAAEHWRRRLSGTGRSVTFEVPAATDLLALSVQLTIARTFDAGGELMVAHAARGAPCSTTVEVGPSEVVVRSATLLPPAGPDRPDELGPALHGLRERVDLSRGSFHAAADQSRLWVLTVALPLG